jgi:hypothetical protein
MEDLNAGPYATRRADAGSGVADAVVHEVARLLRRLAVDPDFADVIDLRSLPMADADRASLRQRLGDGEIDAALNLAGLTRIRDTAYSGVWWARHADADNRCVLEQIIVARVPELLMAHLADIDAAAVRLSLELSRAQGKPEHA